MSLYNIDIVYIYICMYIYYTKQFSIILQKCTICTHTLKIRTHEGAASGGSPLLLFVGAADVTPLTTETI